MKLEPRGKYPGVKVHLEPDECLMLLKTRSIKSVGDKAEIAGSFVAKLAKKIEQLQQEIPALLEERTEQQIRKELEEERDKAIQKLAAIDGGKDWKKVGK